MAATIPSFRGAVTSLEEAKIVYGWIQQNICSVVQGCRCQGRPRLGCGYVFDRREHMYWLDELKWQHNGRSQDGISVYYNDDDECMCGITLFPYGIVSYYENGSAMPLVAPYMVTPTEETNAAYMLVSIRRGLVIEYTEKQREDVNRCIRSCLAAKAAGNVLSFNIALLPRAKIQ